MVAFLVFLCLLASGTALAGVFLVAYARVADLRREVSLHLLGFTGMVFALFVYLLVRYLHLVTLGQYYGPFGGIPLALGFNVALVHRLVLFLRVRRSPE